MLMFSLYIMCFTYNLLYCYMFSKNVSKIQFKITKKLLLISSLFSIISCINFHYNNTALKPFISNLIGFIIMKVYYRETYGKTLIGLLVSFIVVSVSELLFAFIAVYGLNITQEN